MFQVIQACVRRRFWSSARFTVRFPGLTRQLCNEDQGTVRGCVVDSNLEEQFVFVDCTDSDVDPRQEENLHQISLQTSPAPPAQRHPRSLQQQQQQQQLQLLRKKTVTPSWSFLPDPSVAIQFHDVDYPVDGNIVAAQKKKKKKKKKNAGKGEHKVFGTPDADEPVSDTSCAGCGAILQCASPHKPGYLPSEKYKTLLQEEGLNGATCQRCHLLTHHHKALALQISRDQYRAVVQQIRPHQALVLLIVDLLDVPESVVPDLPELVGDNKHVVVLGNKVDLLPGDSPNYLQRIKRQLGQYCRDAGFMDQVTDIHLISAKTGYGIENLISSLQSSWRYKGDVYLVGNTNAGKSTLFNTLLESDYCKSRSSELISKATISPWPGTTLNLLKFPIINPTPYRMFRRQKRLNEASQQTESELSEDELKRLRTLSRRGYVAGRIGRTFRFDAGSRPDEIQFDPDRLAFGDRETRTASSRPKDDFTYNELKDAHWLYDTPGILKERDILALLSEEEVRLVVPSRAIIPRTFVLKPGMSLFVGALARIDFLQGAKSCWFSVVASNRVPVHITSVEKAEGVYEKHAGHILLGVPVGGPERMKEFPVLVPQEFGLEGRGYLEAAADVKLSSAGWVAVTAAAGDQVSLRVHGPEAAGFGLRSPPLLPRIVSLKGERIRGSPAYKPMKAAVLLDAGISAHGATRPHNKHKALTGLPDRTQPSHEQTDSG